MTHVKVSSEGIFHLKKAIELSLIYHTGTDTRKNSCDWYMIYENAIYFGWGNGDNPELLTKFPTAMGIDILTHVALDWILKSSDYGKEPDIDGSCSRGWTLISGYRELPDIPNKFYVDFGLKPCWIEYHK